MMTLIKLQSKIWPQHIQLVVSSNTKLYPLSSFLSFFYFTLKRVQNPLQVSSTNHNHGTRDRCSVHASQVRRDHSMPGTRRILKSGLKWFNYWGQLSVISKR